MQLGFVSAIVPELSLEKVFSLATEQGYDCIELMCWPVGKAERRYAGVTHLDVVNFDQQRANEIRSLADSHKVDISALGYYPNPLSPDHTEAEVAVEHLHQLIEASALLKLNRVNTFIGRDWTKSLEANWQRFLDTWTPLVEFAEQHRVKIGIENCPMLFSSDEWPGGKNLAISPAVWRKMFAAIPSDYFGLNYDPSHLIWQQMDPIQPLREFAERIFHVHAKDVRVDRHRLDEVGVLALPPKYHTPKLPGFGELDWSCFISTLNETGYTGPVCVEVEDRAFEETLELRKQALKLSHTYLRNFIPHS